MTGNLGLILVAIAALIVAAEGLNKLERTDALRRGLPPKDRAAAWLRLVGWAALVLAAGGAVFMPILPTEYLHAGYGLCIAGSASLIVRARVEPPIRDALKPDGDAFDRTQRISPEDLAKIRALAIVPEAETEKV